MKTPVLTTLYINYLVETITGNFSIPSIADGSILVKLAAGGDDDTGAMRRQLQKESAKTPNGAAFRWAVGAAPNGFLELQLQSLPMPAAVINSKPMLRNVSIPNLNCLLLLLTYWQ